MTIEWSVDALADLERFAKFLHDRFPSFAAIIAGELIEKLDLLSQNPMLGHPVSGHKNYRQLIVRVLGGAYVVYYLATDEQLTILRVFHGREARTIDD
ncbi:MAG: type II toxin-antitoxin system RelE/ParE family toxin [Pseudolabrys sp.]